MQNKHYDFQFNVPAEYLVKPRNDYFISAYSCVNDEGKVISGVVTKDLTNYDLVLINNWQAVLIDIQSVAFEYYRSILQEQKIENI